MRQIGSGSVQTDPLPPTNKRADAIDNRLQESDHHRYRTALSTATPTTRRGSMQVVASLSEPSTHFLNGVRLSDETGRSTVTTNPHSMERQQEGKVDYEWGSLWPHFHKEKMNWATGFRTSGDVDILFLSGSTGRDPFNDAPNRTREEEQAGRGKVVGGITEQTRQALQDIKDNLEMMGASLINTVMFRYYIKNREDVFDMRDEMYRFFEEHEPDLRAHPRPATLIRGVGIDLPEMLIEIEAWAVVPRTA